MALSSMTGFARSHGASGPYAFEWELKSVNAKGFDLRMRLPPGWDELEAFAKKRAGEVLSRGTVYANLNVKRANAVSTVRVNEEVLTSILKVAGVLAGKIDAVAQSIDGLLAIKARLAEQVAALLESSDRFDPDRLNQEALLIAAKADIREELDRIASHIAQAREMIGKGGPVGRRLDFLAQEFNREVNTCCSKSNDLELTNTGLEMKNVVEQFREQVQNLE